MSDQLESDLSGLLHMRADTVVRPPLNTTAVVRRARIRLARTTAVAGVAVAALVVGVLGIVATTSHRGVPVPLPVTGPRHSNGEIVLAGGPASSPLSAIDPDGSEPHLLVRPPTPTDGYFDAARWSPDGTRLAFMYGHFGGGNSTTNLSLYVVDADGAHVRRLTGCPTEPVCDTGSGGGSNFAWSPSGRSIVLAAKAGLYSVDVATAATRLVVAAPGYAISAPDWSPTSDLLAYVRDERVHLVTPDGRGEQVLRHPTHVQTVRFSPDGEWLAVSASDGVHVLDIHGRYERHLVRLTAAEGPEFAVWSPDQTHLLYFETPKYKGDFVPRVSTVDVRTGRSVVVFSSRLSVSDWSPPTWSPDGQFIAFALSVDPYGDDSAPHLYVVRSDGTDLRRYLLSASPFSTPWRPLP